MPSAEKTLRAPALPALTAPVDPGRFVEVTGERVALLGREDGPFECWIWPLKVFHDLGWVLRRADDGSTLSPEQREISVSPGEIVYRQRGRGFTLRVEIFACPERRGLALLFTPVSDAALELELSFRCDFRPMWPAGLGGQLAGVDRVTEAFALTEERGRYAALIGAPGCRVEFLGVDHALPDGPVSIRLPFPAGPSSAVIAVAGAELQPEELSEARRRGGEQASGGFARAEPVLHQARELWFRLASDWSAEREQLRDRYRAFLSRTARLATPEPALDGAFQWSLIAIERAWTEVDGLGRGLIAGLAPSGASERPGYGWFFDGDALAASRALTTAGDFEGSAAVLRFAAAHQRDDGKLMHELTLSAPLCDWLGDYPYAHRKGINAADFVAALDHHLRITGDLELARELWPAAERALEWTASCADERGLLLDAKAGLAPVEAGALAGRIRSEVFLQGACLAALAGAIRLAVALGHDAARYQDLARAALEGFETFWSEERGRYGFAHLADGTRCDDLTAYVAQPLARGFGDPVRAWATVRALNAPELASDWGARTFAADSAAHDPASHDTSAVFPYLTNFVTLAHFARGNAAAGRQVLFSQVALCHFGGLGFLEERLEGERARVPRHGVPHRILSSAALIESTLFGLFGLDVDGAKRRLVLRPSLPSAWNAARIENLRIGETRVDLEFYRRREPRETRLGVGIEHRSGPSLQVAFAPILTPLSVALVGPVFVHPSGAVVPRTLRRAPAERLALEVLVLEGPSLEFPWSLPPRGETSRAARLVDQKVDHNTVTWTIAGPANTTAELPFHCDRPIVELAGGALERGILRVAFDAGAPGEWKSAQVSVRVR